MIEHKKCPVDDHRANGAVERCIQTIKRKLGTTLMSSSGNVEMAITTILDTMRKTKHSVTKKSPHFLHFGRKPNTPLSNLHSKLVLDAGQLKRSMLTTEEKKSDSYSKDRLKFIRPSESSAEGRKKFKPTKIPKFEQAAQEAMSELVQASEKWKYVTQRMGTVERSLLARDILKPSQADYNLIKDIDTNGLGLHLKEFPSRIQESDESEELNLTTDKHASPAEKRRAGQDRASKLLNLAKSNPSGVIILRRVYNRASGAALFKKYSAVVKSFTPHTVTFENGTMLRISDIQIKEIPNETNPSDSGKSSKKKLQKSASQKLGASSSKTKSKTVKEPFKIPKRKAKVDSSSEGNFSLEDTLKQCFPKQDGMNVNKTPVRNRLFFNKNRLPGKTYLPAKYARNQRSISPVIEPEQDEDPVVMPSPPQRPQSSRRADR